MVVTTDQDERLHLPPPPPRWWLRAGVGFAVVCALIAGGLWAREHFLVRCADGVSRTGPHDECIGVTDGAYHFDHRLADVTDRIHRENQAVEKSGDPWVGVAYFEPMTLGDGDKGWASVRQELQGAYLAQLALNHHPRGGRGELPRIKLLLANPGRGSGQWEVLVEQILGMTDDRHPVVAVAGFGQSRATTKAAVEALRAEDVPMMGSTVTADGLSEKGEPGFFRAVAPNGDQTAAVVQHLASQQADQQADQKAGESDGEPEGKPGFTVQIIKDRNDDDIYSDSLRRGFFAAAGKYGLDIDSLDLQFLSKVDGVSNALASVADKVCDQASLPDAVYFAGRGRDLRGFIEAAGAGGRSCEVTVYTADDAVGMFFDLQTDEKRAEYENFLRRWHSSGVEVRYTALAHPAAAARIYQGEEDNPYPPFLRAYETEFGGRSGLFNGQAMLGHDALTALGVAIRKAADPGGRESVTSGDVRQMLPQINGPDTLRGVSGPIAFGMKGNPVNKPLPLVRLTVDVEHLRHGYVLEDVLRLEGPPAGS